MDFNRRFSCSMIFRKIGPFVERATEPKTICRTENRATVRNHAWTANILFPPREASMRRARNALVPESRVPTRRSSPGFVRGLGTRHARAEILTRLRRLVLETIAFFGRRPNTRVALRPVYPANQPKSGTRPLVRRALALVSALGTLALGAGSARAEASDLVPEVGWNYGEIETPRIAAMGGV